MGTEAEAARAEVVASREAFSAELVRLEAAGRAAVDIKAKVRRNPAQAAGLAAGAGFLALGGPRRGRPGCGPGAARQEGAAAAVAPAQARSTRPSARWATTARRSAARSSASSPTTSRSASPTRTRACVAGIDRGPAPEPDRAGQPDLWPSAWPSQLVNLDEARLQRRHSTACAANSAGRGPATRQSQRASRPARSRAARSRPPGRRRQPRRLGGTSDRTTAGTGRETRQRGLAAGRRLDSPRGEWRNGRRAGLRSRCRVSGVRVRVSARPPVPASAGAAAYTPRR